MIRRPPRSTLFPYTSSSDLKARLRRSSNRSALPLGLGTGVFLLYLLDRKSTRLNSSHSQISYAVFCLKKKTSPSCDTLMPFVCAKQTFEYVYVRTIN